DREVEVEVETLFRDDASRQLVEVDECVRFGNEREYLAHLLRERRLPAPGRTCDEQRGDPVLRIPCADAFAFDHHPERMPERGAAYAPVRLFQRVGFVRNVLRIAAAVSSGRGR